jgi:hypothetical protein
LIAVLIQRPTETFDYQTSISWKNIFLGNSFDKWKGWNKSLRLADERRKKNNTLTPSELAASHPGNHEYRYDSIAGIEIKTGFLETHLKIKLTDPARQDRSFRINKKQAAEARPMIELVLPSKLKGK